MTVLCSFDVVGVPRPQGSRRAYVVNGKARLADAAGTAGVQWRDAIAHAAKTEADRILDSGVPTELVPPFDGALALEVSFRFPLPKARTKAQRLAATGSGSPKTTAPDTTKLVRSLEDGLTAAGLIVDDARIVHVSAGKWEVTGWTGASIRIRRMTT